MKMHLAETHKDSKPYECVPEDVKNEIRDFFKKREQLKMVKEREYDEMVDTGAYYNSHAHASTCKGGPSTGSVPKRGVRGPMDHFMINLDQEDDGEDAGTQMNAKEARNRCALDVGRSFY